MVAVASLADVVEQRAQQQQVGPRNSTRQGRGLDRSFDEMAIDGVAMQGIVLPAIANAFPLRNQSRHQTGLIERFEHDERRPAGTEQRDECVARRSTGHGVGIGGHLFASRSMVGGDSGNPT